MFFLNVLLSAGIISLCAWLAQKRPDLAGFIVSLPLSTLLVLALNQIQSGDSAKGTILAKSIFVAIPSTLVFFIPFLFAEKLRLPFWVSYCSGIALLGGAFFVHRFVFGLLTK
jgi:hypothetical protein